MIRLQRHRRQIPRWTLRLAGISFGSSSTIVFSLDKYTNVHYIPCDKIQAFASDGHDHHRITVENLKRMREIGLDKWLSEHKNPMFCPGWRF